MSGAAYFVRNGMVTRLSDGACIPSDDGNDDYQRYLNDSAVHKDDPGYIATGDHDPRESVAAIKSAVHAAIDGESETIRLAYITQGIGQAMTYAVKIEQALAYQAATNRNDLSQWPLLEAEVDATGLPPVATVARIIAAHRAWITAAARIERIRVRAKKETDEAATPEAIIAVRNAALAALRALSDRAALRT